MGLWEQILAEFFMRARGKLWGIDSFQDALRSRLELLDERQAGGLGKGFEDIRHLSSSATFPKASRESFLGLRFTVPILVLLGANPLIQIFTQVLIAQRFRNDSK